MVGLTQMVNESLARYGIPVQMTSSGIVSGDVQPRSADARTVPESSPGSSNKEAQIGPPAPLPSGF